MLQNDGEFRKTSFSNPSGNCVEVALTPDGDTVQVRNSRDPEGPALSFTLAEWDAHLKGVRNGEHDLPA